MRVFWKVSGVLLGFFFTMMLFIMLLRLANQKDAFISIRVLWNYIESIDLSRAWNELQSTFMELVRSFEKIGIFNENATEWEKFFEVLSNLGTAIFQLLKFPIDILLAVLNFIYDILDMIRRFFIVVLQ